jgi:hypothetical protein
MIKVWDIVKHIGDNKHYTVVSVKEDLITIESLYTGDTTSTKMSNLTKIGLCFPKEGKYLVNVVVL